MLFKTSYAEDHDLLFLELKGILLRGMVSKFNSRLHSGLSVLIFGTES